MESDTHVSTIKAQTAVTFPQDLIYINLQLQAQQLNILLDHDYFIYLFSLIVCIFLNQKIR